MSEMLVSFLVILTLALTPISDVEAKRFGGGGSFGSKQSYSSPYRRSTSSQPGRSASQQQTNELDRVTRQKLNQKGGLMGLLGGLALGGLLGSLFFGGAFEGFNFMDILIFGGIAFSLYQLFASSSKPAAQSAYNAQDHTGVHYQPRTFSMSSSQNRAGFDTDALFKKDQSNHFNAEYIDQPTDFNEADFLSGAKETFNTLQAAWEQGDLAEIRGLTTDKVFAEIQDQIKALPTGNHTDVLKIDAELISIREVGGELEAVVLFDAIIREERDVQVDQVREVWHFIKPKNSLQPKWYLDGIQQLEQ